MFGTNGHLQSSAGVFLAVWVCGCVFGYVGVRVCFDCVGVRVCSWLCGCAGVFLAVWVCGCAMAVWECGCVFGSVGVGWVSGGVC